LPPTVSCQPTLSSTIEQKMRPMSEYRQLPRVSLKVCWHFKVSGML
jgi:hypothetical protein